MNKQVTKGAPERNKRKPASPLRNTADNVVKAALFDPGEWYSLPLPEGTNHNSTGPTILTAIVSAVADYSTKDGRIWVRFNTEKAAND